jgi:hypothetical protein
MLTEKVYILYFKNDPNKEAINRINAFSLNDAISYFSEKKQIDEYTFLQIFNVEEYGY